MPLLVHGVLTAADDTADPDWVSEVDEDVHLLVDGELAALVREIESPEALPSRANLLAHARVLEQAAAATTIAPMRFGVVVADRETLADHLRQQHDHLLEVLGRLEGHLEYRLQGRYAEDEVVREVVAGDPRAQRLRGRESVEARMELGERVVAGIEARRATDRAHAVERLAPVVAEVAVSDVTDPLDAFSVSLLVDLAAHEAFDERIEALGTELEPTVSLELVGPVPPVSFAGRGAVA